MRARWEREKREDGGGTPRRKKRAPQAAKAAEPPPPCAARRSPSAAAAPPPKWPQVEAQAAAEKAAEPSRRWSWSGRSSPSRAEAVTAQSARGARARAASRTCLPRRPDEDEAADTAIDTAHAELAASAPPAAAAPRPAGAEPDLLRLAVEQHGGAEPRSVHSAAHPPSDAEPRAPSRAAAGPRARRGAQRPGGAACPVFSSSAPGRRPGTSAAPTGRRRRRAFGPDAEKGGGRKKGKNAARFDQEAVDANIAKTMQRAEGPRRAQAARRSDEPSDEEIDAARAAEERSARRSAPRQRVHHGQRAREILKMPATQIVGFAFKEPRLDGHDQPAPRLRPDRADRRRVRLPGGARGGVPGRGGRATAVAGRAAEELVLAAAGRHDHGSRRPRQDVAARLHPQGERRRRRGRRHHAAHRRVPRRAARRQVRSRSSTRRATRRSPPCVRAARRSPTSSCSSSRPTTRDAADDRSDLARQERRRADDRRDQQDRPAARRTRRR